MGFEVDKLPVAYYTGAAV